MPVIRYKKLVQWLTGRIARNIYFWALMLAQAFMLNAGNDRAYHYGITASSWYLPVMLTSLLLQCGLVYGNNLWLVPRFLAKRRRFTYAGLTLALALLVSVLYVVLFKLARRHINVEEIQHPAFITTVISGIWTLRAILNEAVMFFIGELAWIFVFTMAWYMNDYAVQRRALHRSEHQRIQTELAFLKNQINPHFLFNTLNNIYGLSLQQSAAAPDAILKLSALMRYLLYESDTELISFQRERAAMEAYVEIEALRLPEHASIRLDLSADKDYLIPALLWMPLLKNAFKHGTRLINEAIFIDFRFRIEASRLSIDTNNGCVEAVATPSGIGIANLRKRLDLLFPGRYTFREQRGHNTYSSHLAIQLP